MDRRAVSCGRCPLLALVSFPFGANSFFTVFFQGRISLPFRLQSLVKSIYMDEQLIEKQDDELSLIDLFAVLWQRKVMIIAITGIAIIGVLIFSILSLKLPPEKSFLPNKYTPQAQMLIND
ncbi:MAG: hypothetical protein IKD07_02415, partial [Clostridia bacterium]|nr:hypothetical protein [Clostridia bacterium]